MKFSWYHLVAIAALAVVILLAWFAGPMFHLAGWDRAILSIGILIIGAAVIGAFVWWASSQAPGMPKPAMSVQAPGMPAMAAPAGSISGSFAPASVGPDDIQLLVREAESKVASARLGHGAKLSSLRVIFMLGEAESGKTSAVLHSGLDPELLAGQVFREGSVLPTAAANFWFARKCIVVDAGSALMGEPRLWARLIHRLRPRGLGAIFGKKSRAERAAVVCFDCDKLAKSPSGEGVAGAARALRARMEEMSQILGSSFPVYVLFTRADRLPFFDDFAATMTNEETAQVLGVTLPMVPENAPGVYAERETKRLAAAFNALFYSLADLRPGMLSRERNAQKQPGVYEFPRQFRKLGKPLVQFLVDLCRPSQLRAGPFLRGFYFSGIRSVASSSAGSQTMMATRTTMPAATPAPASNATTILRVEDLPSMGSAGWQTSTQMQAGSSEPRKAQQWVFLTHIFPSIVLQDKAALSASGASTRVNFWRRALLATAGALAVIWIFASLISFVSNRQLESDFLKAAQSVHVGDPALPPTADSLQQIETLRKSLAELTGYERNGAPLHLRWGLYSGDAFYPDARRIYFTRFRQLLFGQIQAAILSTLQRLPATPGPSDEYGPVYDTLKAYLITTSDSDKSTPGFLTPVLQKYWVAGQNMDANSQALAKMQFDFYATELKFGNPYPSDADAAAVSRARDYLNHFGAVPRIYTAMQLVAAKQNPSVNFYRDHPGAGDIIRNVPEVPGAFTKGGWAFMQDAIAHSDKYFRGEEWVLGTASAAIANRGDLESQLRTMYLSDFLRHWRDYLNSARILPYGTPEDGAKKLQSLSSNDSPVLALLCDVSMNTVGLSADVDKAFRPVQQIEPPPACQVRPVSGTTTPYVQGLAKLQSCFDTLVAAPPDQKTNQTQQCTGIANDTKLVVATQIAPGMDVDPDGHIDKTVVRLLTDAINAPTAPVPTAQGAGDLCTALNKLLSKYPFGNPNQPDATLQEVSDFLRPGDGVLAQFAKKNPTLQQQGAQFVPVPDSPVKWSSAFLEVLNRAARVQAAMFPAGATQPKYTFAVRVADLTQGLGGVVLSLDGQSFTYSSSNRQSAKDYVWPGATAHEASISMLIGGVPQTVGTEQGPWAVNRLFGVSAWTQSGSTYRLEWTVRGSSNQIATINGKPELVVFDIDTHGAPPLFEPRGMALAGCPTRATR